MTLKTDLQSNSTDLAALVSSLSSQVASFLSSFTVERASLDANIDLVDSPPVSPAPAPTGDAPTQFVIAGSRAAGINTISHYPYDIQEYNGFLYLSTIGANNSADTGKPSVQKINPRTMTIDATYQYATPTFVGGVQTHNYKGNRVHDGKVYATRNQLVTGISYVDVLDAGTLAFIKTITLGSGLARNIAIDGTSLYAAMDISNTLVKVDLTTDTASVIATFASGSRAQGVDVYDGKIIVILFNTSEIKILNSSGTVLATISAGSGAQPNWISSDPDLGVFVSNYAGQNVLKINMSSYTVEKTYSLPAADYPHQALPLKNWLFVGGTTTPTSPVRVFDIASGSLLFTLISGPNIPAIAFDGGSVWAISANGNYIQRHALETVFK